MGANDEREAKGRNSSFASWLVSPPIDTDRSSARNARALSPRQRNDIISQTIEVGVGGDARCP